MISTLIALLVFCLVAGVLWYIARLLIQAFQIPQPFANIAYALVALLLLALFLSEIGWLGHPHAWRTWR